MNDLLGKLPFELANHCYSFIGTHPNALRIKTYFEEFNQYLEDLDNCCNNCLTTITYYPNTEITAKFKGLCESCYMSRFYASLEYKDLKLGRCCSVCNDELSLYNWISVKNENNEFTYYCTSGFNCNPYNRKKRTIKKK